MSEEKNATSTVKRSWLPSGLLLPMFVAGWISFGFGVVGLYDFSIKNSNNGFPRTVGR
jgi:Ni/Fe-hydrogenase subunit HybB-like protein